MPCTDKIHSHLKSPVRHRNWIWEKRLMCGYNGLNRVLTFWFRFNLLNKCPFYLRISHPTTLNNRLQYLDRLCKESSNPTWEARSKRLVELSNVLILCHALTCGIKEESSFGGGYNENCSYRKLRGATKSPFKAGKLIKRRRLCLTFGIKTYLSYSNDFQDNRHTLCKSLLSKPTCDLLMYGPLRSVTKVYTEIWINNTLYFNVCVSRHDCLCLCTWGAVTLSDGLHRRVPAVASSPQTSEHIRTHDLSIGQKPGQPDRAVMSYAAQRNLCLLQNVYWSHMHPSGSTGGAHGWFATALWDFERCSPCELHRV